MIKGLLLAAYDPLHYLLDSIFVSPGFHRRLFTLSYRTVLKQYYLPFVETVLGRPMIRIAFHAAYILDRSYFPRPPGRSLPYTNSFANCSID